MILAIHVDVARIARSHVAAEFDACISAAGSANGNTLLWLSTIGDAGEAFLHLTPPSHARTLGAMSLCKHKHHRCSSP